MSSHRAVRVTTLATIACCLVTLHARTTTAAAPTGQQRLEWSYEWCDCRTGRTNVTVWPAGDESQAVVITLSPATSVIAQPPHWLRWDRPTDELLWTCGGMKTVQRTVLKTAADLWSLTFTVQSKIAPCGSASGRLHFASWGAASYRTSVPYTSGEGGYECIKIPVLLLTANRTLLALAEARKNSCSDFAWTDLVIKSSRDGGKTWSALRVVRSESGPNLPHTVIGNAAPVQLSSGRILIPHTRNNSDVWLTFSDDDGATWSRATLIPDVVADEWKWVGTGPPGSIQLRESGRIVVPCYHSKYRGNLINNFVHGHVMLSDDQGQSWRLGSQKSGFGAGDKYSNECQAVQLKNGSVLINARSLATFTTPRRIQTISNDGGVTFGPTRFVPELPQPFNGCQGSTIRALNGSLFFTGPDSTVKRDHLTLWRSDDEGGSWQKHLLIDAGASGYSSLQVDPASPGALFLLYEQSDQDNLIMAPDRFIFRRVVF